jgi:hypothetical protein
MQDRTPTAPNDGQPIPDFLPVPRRHQRHDGWTPDRQRAFIEALADTGSVSRAAAMVNMASVGAYQLRRHPELATAADENENFFAVAQPKRRTAVHHAGYKKPTYEMISPRAANDLIVPADAFLDPVIPQPGEPSYSAGDDERPWTMLDQPEELDAWDAAVAQVRAARARELEQEPAAAPLPAPEEPEAAAQPAPPPPPKPRPKPAPKPSPAKRRPRSAKGKRP